MSKTLKFRAYLEENTKHCNGKCHFKWYWVIALQVMQLNEAALNPTSRVNIKNRNLSSDLYKYACYLWFVTRWLTQDDSSNGVQLGKRTLRALSQKVLEQLRYFDSLLISSFSRKTFWLNSFNNTMGLFIITAFQFQSQSENFQMKHKFQHDVHPSSQLQA